MSVIMKYDAAKTRQISAPWALIQLPEMKKKKSRDVTNTNGNADTYGNARLS